MPDDKEEQESEEDEVEDELALTSVITRSLTRGGTCGDNVLPSAVECEANSLPENNVCACLIHVDASCLVDTKKMSWSCNRQLDIHRKAS